MFSSCQYGQIDEETSIWGRFGGEGRLFNTYTTYSDTPTPKWDVQLVSGSTWSNIASNKDFIFVVVDGEKQKELLKLRKRTGRVFAQQVIRVGNYLKYDIECTGDQVYLLYNGILRCFESNSMVLFWDTYQRKNSILCYDVFGSIVIAIDDTQALEFIDKKTGMPIWRTRLDANFKYEYVTTDGKNLIVSGSGMGVGKSIYMGFDIASGEKLWSYISDGLTKAPPQIQGDYVYITEFGLFSTRELRTGKLKWSQIFKSNNPTSIQIETSPAINDRYIYTIFDRDLLILDSRIGHKVIKKSIPEKYNTPKFLLAAGEKVFLILDGNPYMLVYDIMKNEFTTSYSGIDKNIIDVAFSDGVIIQARESVAYYK